MSTLNAGRALLLAGLATLLPNPAHATPPDPTAAHRAAPTDDDEALQEVVVTASPLRSRPLDSVQPVSVLAGDALRRDASASLGETLAHEPGVSSSYYGPVASRPIIRGLTGYRVQMLEDGLPSMDVSSVSDDHAVTLEPALARQIEVLRGPAALLYGSGGAGGVVNVVGNRLPERAPAPGWRGAFEARGDTALGERTGVAELAATAGGFTWHVDGYRRSTDELRIPGFAVSSRLRQQLEAEGVEFPDARGRVPNSGSDSWGAGASGNYFGPQASLGIALSHFDSEYGLPNEETSFIRMKRDRADLAARLRFDAAPFDDLALRAAYTDYTHTEFEAPGEPGTVFVNRQYELRATLDRVARAGNRATLGLQFSHQDFDAIGEEAFVPPAITQTAALFGVDERDFGAWTLQSGARLDNQKIAPAAGSGEPAYDADALSLSLGALRRFAGTQALALNLTRTQRHPQATELYADGVHGALQRAELGDPTLHRETGYTLDLALRRDDPELGWNLGAFFNRYRDYIYVTPTGALDPAEGLPVYAYRQQDADLYGLEAELKGRVPAVTAGRLQARLFGDALRGRVRASGDNLPSIPPYRLGLGLDYDLAAWHLGIEAAWHAAQQRVASAERPTDAFVDVDLDASWRLELAESQLSVFLRASNLLDAEARVHASPLKDLVPLPGRSLRLGVRLEFGD